MITNKKKQLGTFKPSGSLLESKIRRIVRQQLNEEDLTILNPKVKKKLKDLFIKNNTGIDKLTFKKDGTIIAKKGFFYTHGNSAKKVAERLEKLAAENGIKINITDSFDDWKPWPKDSNFVVEFKVVSITD